MAHEVLERPDLRIEERPRRRSVESPRRIHSKGSPRVLEFRYEIPKDPAFQRNSFAQNLFQALYVPILSALPGDTKKLIRQTGKGAKGFIDNVTKHQAVEALYQGENLGLLQPLWENTRNVRSMPNRLRIVTREITRELEERSHAKESRVGPIRGASIGAGSARSVLEAIENAKLPPDTSIELTFVDKDPEALAYSKQLKKTKSISHPAEFIESSGFEFLRNAPDGSYDFIEIVGLMDYYKDRNVERYFKEARRVLAPNGTLITGNILPNIEQHFVGKAIGWSGMEYREPDKLATLIDRAGLEDIHIIVEPLKVHAVATARKT